MNKLELQNPTLEGPAIKSTSCPDTSNQSSSMPVEEDIADLNDSKNVQKKSKELRRCGIATAIDCYDGQRKVSMGGSSGARRVEGNHATQGSLSARDLLPKLVPGKIFHLAKPQQHSLRGLRWYPVVRWPLTDMQCTFSKVHFEGFAFENRPLTSGPPLARYVELGSVGCLFTLEGRSVVHFFRSRNWDYARVRSGLLR